MQRAVFLDRDGTLNKVTVIHGVSNPPNSIEELKIISGVGQAIEIIRKQDYIPIIVTNQPDVGRGKTTIEIVNLINKSISNYLNIEYVYTCFHDGIEECECRKPKPGLLIKAAKDLGIDLSKSFMVGDRASDVYAGYSAGCECYLIRNEYGGDHPSVPYTGVDSLLDFAYKKWGEHEI
jgi:D-glycero-D-manno-heptose 1,7-bisphosphate phosphatase